MASNRKKVLVPSNMGRAGVEHLRARDDVETVVYPVTIAPADLIPLLPDAEGIVLSLTPFRRAQIEAAPRLVVVARTGVGYDAVEVPPLTERKIPLMVVGTANSTSVAEQAMFFVMTLAKRGAALDGLVRAGRWHERYQHLPMELSGKTILVIGFGRIGTRAARRFAALEMRVAVHDPFVPESAIRAAGCEPAPDLDAALAEADVVSIHCPKTPETIGLFNAARIARMKRGAYLVNTARGGIIDEDALHDALVAGHLAGAGLDVMAEEPPTLTDKLFALDSVITSPHIAGNTTESVQAMALAAARNILSVFDGAIIADNVVNAEVLQA
jgi:D-3-phosphoglycerate dehydrogenase